MGRGARPRFTRPLRILLVEDNPDDAEITRRAVARALPCEVEVIDDGAVPVARLMGAGEDDSDRSATSAKPDLILLDLELPAMGGLEVLRRIRGDPKFDRTPVMVLTSSRGDDRTISDAYAWGSNNYFAKPATRPEFAEALQTLALGLADQVA